MLLGFHGAGASDKCNMLAADDDVSRRRGDSKDAVFFLGVPADEFVRLADGNAFADAGHGFEHAKVDCAFVASDANRRAN